MAQARHRSRNACQDRYISEVRGLSQNADDEIKLLTDDATQNDMMEEAKPGDAAWVKDIEQEYVRTKKLFSNDLVLMVPFAIMAS